MRTLLRFSASLVLSFLVFGIGTRSLAAQSPRVVAVGDIHGAFDAFRSILLETDLVDESDHWVGGKTILVQTGDFLDRGADSIRVGLWLRDLQQQAAKAGGQVIVLLGNHEALNLFGDLRFVPPEMLAPLVDKGSEARRLKRCKERAMILRRDGKALKQKVPSASALRRACLEETALGMVEYQKTLRPDHPFGQWLRTLPAVARVGDAIFLHGGISPEKSGLELEEINATARREIEMFDAWRDQLVEAGRMVESATLMEMAHAVQIQRELNRKQAEEQGAPLDPAVPDLAGFLDLNESQLLHLKGPLWFRGYESNSWTEEEGLREMPKILQTLGARHVVTGHTPQKSRHIDCRFGGRAFLIDTGMLASHYKGVPAALQFQDGRVEGIYLGKRETFLDEQKSWVAESCN